MKRGIALLFCLFLFNGFSQNAELSERLEELETFLNGRIPIENLGVEEYKITLKNGILKKRAIMLMEKTKTKTYDMRNPKIEAVHQLVGEINAKNTGYWDVTINGEWIAREIKEKADADFLVALLEQINKLVYT